MAVGNPMIETRGLTKTFLVLFNFVWVDPLDH